MHSQSHVCPCNLCIKLKHQTGQISARDIANRNALVDNSPSQRDELQHRIIILSLFLPLSSFFLSLLRHTEDKQALGRVCVCAAFSWERKQTNPIKAQDEAWQRSQTPSSVFLLDSDVLLELAAATPQQQVPLCCSHSQKFFSLSTPSAFSLERSPRDFFPRTRHRALQWTDEHRSENTTTAVMQTGDTTSKHS